MNFSNSKIAVRTLLVLIIAIFISPALIASETGSSSLGKVVVPRPATPANEQQCVEPVDVMRRDHMKFLLHQRNETVLDGIRTKKYSLTGCIDCHAQTPPDGKIVRAEDPDYFCTTCHAYTSVKIDCFECHSDQPAAAEQSSRSLTTPQLLARIDSITADLSLGNRVHQILLQQVEIRDD